MSKAKDVPTLQELSSFMRNVAYSDDMENEIGWSLSVVHPRNNDGVVGFSGGLWHSHTPPYKGESVSVSFSFDELNGITDFSLRRDQRSFKNSVLPSVLNLKPSFEQFKDIVCREFGIKELYKPKGRKEDV